MGVEGGVRDPTWTGAGILEYLSRVPDVKEWDVQSVAVTAFENALAVYQESKLYKHGAITEKNLDRALDLVDWYLPHGRRAIELTEKPVVELAALKKPINSGQVVEVIQ